MFRNQLHRGGAVLLLAALTLLFVLTCDTFPPARRVSFLAALDPHTGKTHSPSCE